MKIEPLKQLAEYMGHKNVHVIGQPIGLDCVFYRHDLEKSVWEYRRYDPINNAEQCLELMEKFKMSLDWDTEKFHWVVFTNGIWMDGKTINEAVTNAAIAAIKG